MEIKQVRVHMTDLRLAFLIDLLPHFDMLPHINNVSERSYDPEH